MGQSRGYLVVTTNTKPYVSGIIHALEYSRAMTMNYCDTPPQQR